MELIYEWVSSPNVSIEDKRRDAITYIRMINISFKNKRIVPFLTDLIKTTKRIKTFINDNKSLLIPHSLD